MSNIHEYVVFDRANLDPVLAMRWPAFENAHPGWNQWKSAKDFLVEWALDESQRPSVDAILATKTVRATMALSDSPFSFLYGLLDEKELTACSVDIDKGDYDYGDDIVSCAGAAFTRGELSLASLTAVYDLHASRVNPAEVLLPAAIAAIESQPDPSPMLPGWPDLMPTCANGIGMAQTRRVIGFLLRAWDGQWPLQAAGQKHRKGGSIRTCAVAARLVKTLRHRCLSRPCMFRWFEC